MLLTLLACATPDDTGGTSVVARPLAYVVGEVACTEEGGEYAVLDLPDDPPLFVSALVIREGAPWAARDVTAELTLADGVVEVACYAGETVRLVYGVAGE